MLLLASETVYRAVRPAQVGEKHTLARKGRQVDGVIAFELGVPQGLAQKQLADLRCTCGLAAMKSAMPARSGPRIMPGCRTNEAPRVTSVNVV